MRCRLILTSCYVVLLTGCSYWDVLTVRPQSPDPSGAKSSNVRKVGDIAVPFGLDLIQVRYPGLVTGLNGTGSDPAPSEIRAMLIDDMQTRGVEQPNQVLRDPSTALVVVEGWLKPGIQKGDRFDVVVHVPSRSGTTSLHGGFLMETRLKQMAMLNNQFRKGHLLALAKGPVLIAPSTGQQNDTVPSAASDAVAAGRGRILGGGVALKSRPLGLVLKTDHQSVANSARIEGAVNRRFHTFDRGIKNGVATAKTDEFVELQVHPKYKNDIPRYLRVIRAVAIRESAGNLARRLGSLRERLLDPVTAADAAIELESLGHEGVDSLLVAVRSTDPEVRFYAAEALAYLDRQEAAKPLGEAARREPAFRAFALNALIVLDDYAACEQLRDLLEVSSAETRYGAFRALWTMNPRDSLVMGERLGDQFSYHVLGTAGPAMIHVTRSRRPEIVLFGQNQRFVKPLAVDAGNEVMVTSVGPDEISVSKYAVGRPDQKRIVSTRVDAVIRAIVELGGTYPDVVQTLMEAKQAGALQSRFEVDALPSAGRSYDRVAGRQRARNDSDRSDGSRTDESAAISTDATGDNRPEGAALRDESGKTGADSESKSQSPGGFFARMIGRRSK